MTIIDAQLHEPALSLDWARLDRFLILGAEGGSSGGRHPAASPMSPSTRRLLHRSSTASIYREPARARSSRPRGARFGLSLRTAQGPAPEP